MKTLTKTKAIRITETQLLTLQKNKFYNMNKQFKELFTKSGLTKSQFCRLIGMKNKVLSIIRKMG